MRLHHYLLLAAVGLVITWSYSLSETQASHTDHGCKGCHTPHNADPEGSQSVPLWNNVNLDDADLPLYTLYSSNTLDATDLGQPDGASKLCLGCHDGTYLKGGDPNRPIGEHAVFGTDDLAHSHPISFTYATAQALDDELHAPNYTVPALNYKELQKELLDGQGKMQCSSCHDVHDSGKGDAYLRIESQKDLCKACHAK